MRFWSATVLSALIVIGVLGVGWLATRAGVADASQSSAGPTQPISMTEALTFEPSHPTVVVGTTVVWTNTTNPTDNIEHTATSDDLKTFDSGLLTAGSTFSVTFNTVGTFGFFCEVHGASNGTGMAGTITVVSPSVTPTPSPVATLVPTVTPTIVGHASHIAYVPVVLVNTVPTAVSTGSPVP